MIKNSQKINLVGEIVRKFRIKNTWSQEHFAEISGIGIRTLQRIESGERANAETLRAIASALDWDAKTLVPLNVVVEAGDVATVEDQARKEIEQIEQELHVLPRVQNGTDLLSAVVSVQALHTHLPPPTSDDEGRTMATLLEMVRDYGDIHQDLAPSQEMDCVLETNRYLEAVESFGLVVFAGKLRGHIVCPGPSSDVQPLRIRYGGVFICRSAEINTFKDPKNNNRESFRFRIPFGPVSFR